MDISLVILAAGIGSRFGGGIKQLEHVGPSGEIIIDYSIHDAIKAGFNKIVFIIRREIYNDFYEVIGKRMEERFRAFGVKWEYAYQETTDAPEGRKKPWGTGHAVMACKGLVDGPFAVINADDYYGKDAFAKAYDFLKKMRKNSSEFGMVGYVLKNTLSDNGGVTRGVCVRNEKGELCGIEETKNIVKTRGGAETEGKKLDPDALVSMNFWMFPAKFVDILDAGFPAFKAGMKDPLKDEYLLPGKVDELIKKKKCRVKVVPTGDKWFGVTYKEDKPAVVEAFKKLYRAKAYEKDLYSDIK